MERVYSYNPRATVQSVIWGDSIDGDLGGGAGWDGPPKHEVEGTQLLKSSPIFCKQKHVDCGRSSNLFRGHTSTCSKCAVAAAARPTEASALWEGVMPRGVWVQCEWLRLAAV